MRFGTLRLTSRVDDQEPERRKIIFDPIPRVDGIDSSGDPLTEVRSEIYLLSGRRRRAAAALIGRRGTNIARSPRKPCPTRKITTSSCSGAARPANTSPGRWLRGQAGRGRSRGRYLGGSCPNIACLPSKNVIHSAKVASYFRRSEEFGIAKEAGRSTWPPCRDRKRKMVDGLIEMHRDKYQGQRRGTRHGAAAASSRRRRSRSTLTGGGTRTLRGKTVVINTGSRARIDDTPGLQEAGPLTHIEALELDHIPDT